MNFKIYIQSMNNFPIADWAVSAYMGFKERQADIILFEDIEEVPASRSNIVVSYIEETVKYFNKLDIEVPKALNIPLSIYKYAGRVIEQSTIGICKRIVNLNWPVFIKPVKIKQFVPGIIKNKKSFDIYLGHLDDDVKVLVSEVVDFVSEYRGYVIDGKLVGIKHYIGDFRVFPDMKVIDAAIKDYINAPAGYSIDFGVTSDGRTLLVECNDGWSLGNYGLNDSTYVSLLCKRWIEILKQDQNKIW
jgi:hypothetical protein